MYIVPHRSKKMKDVGGIWRQIFSGFCSHWHMQAPPGERTCTHACNNSIIHIMFTTHRHALLWLDACYQCRQQLHRGNIVLFQYLQCTPIYSLSLKSHFLFYKITPNYSTANVIKNIYIYTIFWTILVRWGAE